MFDPTKYTKSKWLKGSDLPAGRPITVTIKRAYEHTFEQASETKPALEFQDLDQHLVLNKTQIVALIGMFGDNVALWQGQRVHLLAIPSNYQGKPTVLITPAQAAAPTFNGQPAQPEVSFN